MLFSEQAPLADQSKGGAASADTVKQHTLHRAAGANRRPRPGFFPPPALRRGRALHLSAIERRDLARLESIGRVPVLERTAADHAFEDAFEIGALRPCAIADAIAGLLAGHRAAERRAGHPIGLCLSVDMNGLDTKTAARVRRALQRGVQS